MPHVRGCDDRKQTNVNGDQFTVKEIVVEIRDDLKKLAARIDHIDREGSIGTKGELTDHETRLRAIERWRYAIPPALLVALGSLGVALWHH